MLSGKDHLGRLTLIPTLIRKYQITEDPKYLRQAGQICNDSKKKIREFNSMLMKKMIHLKRTRKKKITEHNQVPFPGLKDK